MTSNGRVAYVYLVGEGSGPSRLAAALDGHPEIASAGAVALLDRSRLQGLVCSCGCPVGNCPFWVRVLAGLAARNHGVPAGGFFARPEGAANAAQPLAALAEAALDVSGKRVFLDSSGDPAHLGALVRNPLIDLRVVNVVREGGPDGASGLREGLKRRMRELSLDRSLERIPAGRRVDLRIERLERDGPAALAPLFDFLGVGAVEKVGPGFPPASASHMLRIEGGER